MDKRVKIEVVKGKEKGARVRHRVARATLQSGNKYDLDMARRGFYRCPYIGVYCPGPAGKRPYECRGKEECFKIKSLGWMAWWFDIGKKLDIPLSEV